MKDLLELLTFLSFVIGAFKSTPEGRKRRAAIRLHKEIEKWRKDRYKFIKGLRKDRDKGRIDEKELNQKLKEWDKHHPEPK